MLNKIKIGPKLIGGFLIVAVIAGIIGIVGISNIKTIDARDTMLYEKATVPIKDLVILAQAFERIRVNMWEMIATQDEGTIEEKAKEIDALREEISKCQEDFEKNINDEKVKKELEDFKASEKIFGEDIDRIVELAKANKDKEAEELMINEADKTAAEEEAQIDSMESELTRFAQQISNDNIKTADSATITTITVLVIGILFAIIIGLFLSRSISNPLAKVTKMLQDMANGEISDKLSMDRSDEIGILAKSMNKLVDTMKDLIIEDGGVVLENAANKDLTKRMKKEYLGQFAKMKENINKVIASLDTALTQVAEATEQVSSASQQISAGGQSLAQGANEQASSLEEVSSSLEEMSSMTKQNAENANQAKNLAGEANGNAAEGTKSMTKMSESINKIKESSDQTAKIVKTIDEIAMQTNLLALNAAVEAARAGEAGRGFAVVAEEVRNLAQRSAQAAKNTADMIAESVKNADGGVKIATEVSKSFESITTSVKKVNDLIAEIAAASNEQAQGIDQVNTAVAQMDKVTQQNAANSEESASAAEELSSQAEELAGMVAQFALSNVSKTTRSAAPVHHAVQHAAATPAQHKQFHLKPETASAKNSGKKGNGKKAELVMAGKGNADDVIPMKDDDLKEF